MCHIVRRYSFGKEIASLLVLIKRFKFILANIQAGFIRNIKAGLRKIGMNMENKDLEKEINTEENNQNAATQEQNEAEVNMKVEENEDEKIASESNHDSELNKLKGELEESKDKYLRLYSEFENFRRRTAKERLELTKTAHEDLVVTLLPVLDDFERAQRSFEKNKDKGDLKSAIEGFSLIQNKFYKLMEQKGLKPMDDKPGIDFDPEIHEAITKIPAPEEKLKGKVVDVVEKGYYLNDKVIRFAKVVIGS